MTSAPITAGQKLASVAILMGVAAFVVAAIVGPAVQGAVESLADLNVEQERLAALTTKRRDLTALEARRAVFRKAMADAAVVYASNRPDAAAGRFTEALRGVGSSFSIDIERLQPAGMSRETGLKALRVDMTARVPPEAVRAFLAAVEAASPPVFIDRLRLAASRERSGGGIEMTASFRTYARAEPAEAAR